MGQESPELNLQQGEKSSPREDLFILGKNDDDDDEHEMKILFDNKRKQIKEKENVQPKNFSIRLSSSADHHDGRER